MARRRVGNLFISYEVFRTMLNLPSTLEIEHIFDSPDRLGLLVRVSGEDAPLTDEFTKIPEGNVFTTYDYFPIVVNAEVRWL